MLLVASDILLNVKAQIHIQFFIVCLVVGCCRADTTVKMRTVITDTAARSDVENPTTHRDVYYRRGAMRRKDSFGDQPTPSVADIANCESRTGFIIDLSAHEYRIYKVMKFWSNAQLSEFLEKGLVKPVQIESHTIDTGERKAFFGYTAKHLITTIKRTPGKGDKGGEETIDGWYIDHEPADLHCAPEFVSTQAMYVLGTTLTKYPDIPHLYHSGPLPTGIAVPLTLPHTESAS